MASKLVFLAVVLLCMTGAEAQFDYRPKNPGCWYPNLKKCCPRMPLLFKDETLRYCMPPCQKEYTQYETAYMMSRSLACSFECVFRLEGLLKTSPTGNTIVNTDALSTLLNSTYLSADVTSKIINKTIAGCKKTLTIAVPCSECKSRAYQMLMCLYNFFINYYCDGSITSSVCTLAFTPEKDGL